MSLINDALKKAQRQRTGDSHGNAPMPGGGSRPSTDTGRPAAFRLQLMLLGGGALLGLMIATGALFFSRREDPAKETPTVAKTETTQSETKAETATQTVAATPNPVPPTPREEPKAEPVKVAAIPDPVVSTKTVAAAAPEPATPAGPAPLPSSRMVNSCEALRVAGIRASATDSKVLMNDRVYRVGDIVDYELGIKLTAVTASSLTFVDATGATYTRNF